MHPGGPFWSGRDEGAWSIPKGEHADDENPLDAARREFAEETGSTLAAAELTGLGTVSQRSGKVVAAWAAEGDLDAGDIRATPSAWNGRRGPAGRASFRRWTAPSG